MEDKPVGVAVGAEGWGQQRHIVERCTGTPVHRQTDRHSRLTNKHRHTGMHIHVTHMNTTTYCFYPHILSPPTPNTVSYTHLTLPTNREV